MEGLFLGSVVIYLIHRINDEEGKMKSADVPTKDYAWMRRVVGVLVMFLAWGVGPTAKADTITFNDSTEGTITALTNIAQGRGFAIGPLGPVAEGFAILLESPDGDLSTVIQSFSVPGGVIGISGPNPTGNPTVDLLSDELEFGSGAGPSELAVTFFSDKDGIGVPITLGDGITLVRTDVHCSDIPGGCTIAENGTVQHALNVTWFNQFSGATFTDSFSFESDNTTEVLAPEPGTLLMLASGLLGLGRLVRERATR